VQGKHAPLIGQSRREQKLALKPWITKAIMVSIYHENSLLFTTCKNQSPSIVAYKKYNLFTSIKIQCLSDFSIQILLLK